MWKPCVIAGCLLLAACGSDAECAVDTDCPLFNRCEAQQCLPIGRVDSGSPPIDSSRPDAGSMDARTPPDARVDDSGADDAGSLDAMGFTCPELVGAYVISMATGAICGPLEGGDVDVMAAGPGCALDFVGGMFTGSGTIDPVTGGEIALTSGTTEVGTCQVFVEAPGFRLECDGTIGACQLILSSSAP